MKFLDETGLKFIATKFKELRDSLTNKVDKVENKQLSSNDYTNEAKAKVDAIPKDPKYTDTVQDLSEYAKKDDITKAISTLTTFKKEIVTSLPSAGKDNVFYLLKDANGKDNNNYLEYLWIDNKWEMVGSTQVDLTNYAKKSDVPSSLSQLKEDENHKLVTTEEKKITNLIGEDYVLFSVGNVESFFESLYLMKCDFPELNFSSHYNFVFGAIPDKKEPVDYSKNVAGYDELRFSGIYQKKVVEEFSDGKEVLILKYNGEPFTPVELANLLINRPNDGDYRCWIHKNMYIELESRFTAKWAVDLSKYSCVVKEKGKQLSTNDYDNTAKAKVDAIPENPKYTDTVQDLSGYAKKTDIESKVDRTELKTKLSELTDDATHRLVTDTEKTAWNNKLDSVSGKDVSRSKTKGYSSASAWTDVSSSRDVEDWIGDFDKRTRENKNALSKYKQQVILTQSQYDALSSTDKNDASKIYFIKE